MIPLKRSVFWGPMAIAIMGGLTIGTVAAPPWAPQGHFWLGILIGIAMTWLVFTMIWPPWQ
jgi:hypothetical protein